MKKPHRLIPAVFLILSVEAAALLCFALKPASTPDKQFAEISPRVIPMLTEVDSPPNGALDGFHLFNIQPVNKEKAMDEQITNRIRHKLLRDPLTATSRILVETHNGVVTISGTVQAHLAGDTAIRIARRTAGVTQVLAYNLLTRTVEVASSRR